MKTFYHSGDLGDILYALPTIRALGGGNLILCNNPKKTRFPMSTDRFNAIAPLLGAQEYINSVTLRQGPPPSSEPHSGRYLDDFRESLRGSVRMSLAEAHVAICPGLLSVSMDKWLIVNGIASKRVVICRSARYQNQHFPWSRVIAKYSRENMIFLGLREEWIAFCKEFGQVQYHQTVDLLEAARLIAGSELFIGNQTCLTAIAEGLKVRMIVEQDRAGAQWSCYFQREGLLLGWDWRIELPEL